MEIKMDNTKDQMEILQRDYENLSKRHERLRGYVEDLVIQLKSYEIKMYFVLLIGFAIGVALSAFVYAVFL